MEKVNEKEEAQAKVDIWKYVLGFSEMAAVNCVVELGIPDVLEKHKDPLTLSDLCSVLGCSPSPLYRIMRFLIHRGIFKEKHTSQGLNGYVQTPMSRLLTTDGEHSVAAFVLLENSKIMLEPWLHLSNHVLAPETTAFEAEHGKDLWAVTAANPSHNKLFNDAMASGARMGVPKMINGCPEVFEGVASLVDVGGGDGTTLRTLLKYCPWIRGINFDLPHVVSVAPECDGVQHVGGDMFKSVPKADAAFLMWILHDWDDEDCINILRKCKEAIPGETGKVIIVDAVIEENEGENKFKDVGLMLDMVMMVHTNNGKERTSKEWDYVLHKAGFSRHTIKHIEDVRSVIEAYP